MGKKIQPAEYSSKLDPTPSPDAFTVTAEGQDPGDVTDGVTAPETNTQEKPKNPKEAKKAKAVAPKEEKPKKAKKAKAVKEATPKEATPKEEKSQIWITENYSIQGRPGSMYAIMYRLVAELSDFENSEKRLEALDAQDEDSCKRVLKTIMISRAELEKRMRSDPEFVKYCDKRTKYYKERAAAGIESAKKVVINPSRFKEGKWVGNIKELFSVCNGTSSDEAINRNIKKYQKAGVAFRQFPRMPRRGHEAYIIMVPARLLKKLNKVLKSVFGDESGKNFAAYLDTNIRSVFEE